MKKNKKFQKKDRIPSINLVYFKKAIVGFQKNVHFQLKMLQ